MGARGKVPGAGKDRNLKSARRLQAFGLHPERHAVCAVGLQSHGLHHAAVTVRIGREVFETQRRPTPVTGLGVDEADFPGLVVEGEALQAMRGELLETAVGPGQGGLRLEAGLAVLDAKERVPDREAFGEVPIVAERTAARTLSLACSSLTPGSTAATTSSRCTPNSRAGNSPR